MRDGHRGSRVIEAAAGSVAASRREVDVEVGARVGVFVVLQRGQLEGGAQVGESPVALAGEVRQEASQAEQAPLRTLRAGLCGGEGHAGVSVVG